VVDELVGGEMEHALDTLVPQWIAADWPLQQPRYLGAPLAGTNGSRYRARRDKPTAAPRALRHARVQAERARRRRGPQLGWSVLRSPHSRPP
jgi:hypothetical protein